ncbi:hypothetical protein [Thioalkalivibrio sp. ALE20]|uniref:hypothetical protein n=1 Tax=Thioalkalivibrio sp. ALE20 TaxID=545275 RepID=UPI00035EF020|nr:hypothetical protein [Thioalkalivibrio sp. ALE20]
MEDLMQQDPQASQPEPTMAEEPEPNSVQDAAEGTPVAKTVATVIGTFIGHFLLGILGSAGNNNNFFSESDTWNSDEDEEDASVITGPDGREYVGHVAKGREAPDCVLTQMGQRNNDFMRVDR